MDSLSDTNLIIYILSGNGESTGNICDKYVIYLWGWLLVGDFEFKPPPGREVVALR
jgi:hypothetical protein